MQNQNRLFQYNVKEIFHGHSIFGDNVIHAEYIKYILLLVGTQFGFVLISIEIEL